jgi:hypothetical protein
VKAASHRRIDDVLPLAVVEPRKSNMWCWIDGLAANSLPVTCIAGVH